MIIFELREIISENLSKVTGAPANQIALILTLLSTIPFCYINYFIHGKYLRLIYSLVVGLFFQFSIFKFNFLHIFISGIATYIFIKFFGRKLSAYYVFIGSLLYLSYLHIRRIFVDYGGWTIDDPTTIYMMSICKFSSLAFSYEDGEKDLSTMKNAHHREYRIVEQPTLLEVLSYIYFYPTSLIGPSIEFKDFINFINETDCYSDLKSKMKLFIKKGGFYLLLSFISMFVFSIINNFFPIENVAEEDFGKHSLLYTFVYLYVCTPGIRARYYSGFIMSYAILIFSGLSYTEKKDEKTNTIIQSFDKGSYGSIKTVEWDINPKNVINEWNKTIHVWLKYNVYTRVININKKPFKDNKNLAGFLTFIASAFWHGFYITYYITFSLLYFYKTSCEVFEKVGIYDFIERHKVLIPIASVFNSLVFCGTGVIFFNVEWDKVITGIRNVRYYPIITIIILYIISIILNLSIKKEKKDTKIEIKKETKKVE